jgi:tetratricopeptide (TPR) repeat protein
LADDVEQWLADEPVQALAESLPARWGRWGRRHRSIVAAALLFLVACVLGLALGLGALAREQARAVAARDEARESHRQALRAVDKHLTNVSESVVLNVPGLQPLRRKLLQEVLEYYAEFLQAHREDTQLRAEVAAAYFRLAQINVEFGTPEEIAVPFQNGLQILEQLVQEGVDLAPSSSLFRGIYRGRARRGISEIDSPLDELPAGAVPTLERAYRLWEQIAERNPQIPGFRNDMAGIQNILGIVQNALGKPGEALEAYSRAHGIWEQLMREHPEELNYKHEVATTYANIAEVYRQQQRPKEALNAQLEGLRLLRELADAAPAALSFQNDLAGGHCVVGMLKSAAEQPDEEVVAAFQEAQRLLDGLTTVSSYQRDMAAVYAERGKWHQRRGRSKEALRAYQEAWAIRQRLLDKNPKHPTYQSDLAESWDQQAHALEALGRRQEALAACWEAVALQRAAYTQAPSQARLRRLLCSFYRDLARLLRGSGRPAEAAELYEIAAGLALCIPAVGQDNTSLTEQAERRQLVDQAVEILRDVYATGFFRQKAQVERLKTDARLEPLRGSEGFRRLLSEVVKD